MDFHTLSRRELQSLCKLNKIPANITNVAMANALQSLDIVKGIEEYLNVSGSEAANVVEQTEKVKVFSPKAPQTRCRISTRQRVKTTETENLPPTATRKTAHRAAEKVVGGVEESKNDMLKTPAISSTRRKAVETSSIRNVNSQLNECEEEMKEEGLVDQKVAPAPVLMYSHRKVETVKKESTVQKAYSTRQSTRLTEKKSAESRVQKDSGKAVKIYSFLDEDVSGSLNPSAEVEDICNTFEKLDVLVVEKIDCSPVLAESMDVEAADKSGEEKEDSGEVELESVEEEKNAEEYDQKLESDESLEQTLDLGAEILDASEEATDDNLTVLEGHYDSLVNSNAGLQSDESLEQTLDLGAKILDGNEAKHANLTVPEEHSDSLVDSDASTESEADDTNADAEMEQEDVFCAVSEMNNQVLESNGNNTDMILDNTESDNEKSLSPADEMTENTDDETFDVISTIKLQDPKPVIFTETTVNEKADSAELTHVFEDSSVEDKSQLFVSDPCFPPRATPIKKATPFKNMSIVSDDKENNDRGIKLTNVFVDERKNGKKERDATEFSLRQLRKQIKALTLKSNGNKDASKEAAATTRPALRVVCENQLVGGESKN